MGVEPKEARDQRQQEFDAARKVGAAAELVTGVPLKGFEKAPVLRYPNQATFHPLRYLRGLAAAIRDKGGRIFANSPVISVEELPDGGVRVSTENGGVIEAASAVVATNSPINDRFQLHTKMSPYRTYAMAFTLPRGDLPDALFWDTGDPYHYVRMNPGPGSVDYLIAGGADHKSGEADDGDIRFEAIEAWIRALVPTLGQGGHALVRAGPRHDRLLRLHRPQSRQQVRLCRHRRFRTGHDAWRAVRPAPEGSDFGYGKPLDGGL